MVISNGKNLNIEQAQAHTWAQRVTMNLSIPFDGDDAHTGAEHMRVDVWDDDVDDDDGGGSGGSMWRWRWRRETIVATTWYTTQANRTKANILESAKFPTSESESEKLCNLKWKSHIWARSVCVCVVHLRMCVQVAADFDFSDRNNPFYDSFVSRMCVRVCRRIIAQMHGRNRDSLHEVYETWKKTRNEVRREENFKRGKIRARSG